MTDHPHGTRARYIIDGCRCILCTDANAEYQRTRRHGKRRTVPTRRVTEYLRHLTDKGVSLRSIAEATQIPHTTVQRYHRGERATLPTAYAGLLLTYEPET